MMLSWVVLCVPCARIHYSDASFAATVENEMVMHAIREQELAR